MNEAYGDALAKAKNAEERKRAGEKAPSAAAFGERFLKLAGAHPGTKEELFALCWAAVNAPNCEAGRKAIAVLTERRIAASEVTDLLDAYNAAFSNRVAEWRPLAPALLARAKRSLDHPLAAALVDRVCESYRYDDSDKAPATYNEAADLLVDRFVDSPNIGGFAESLGSQPWAGQYEKHLRRILDKNRTVLVRGFARFALATVVRAGGIGRQDEAEKLLRQFVADYSGKEKEPEADLFQVLVQEAKQQLTEIARCGLGKPAREIEGADLEGKPLKLSAYKGKVVLLVFWASWCRPCMADVEHEKELVERFKGRPFLLIGVNGDSIKDDAVKAAARAGISWRSAWAGPYGGQVVRDWAVAAWPTVYVIDHEGVIRHAGLRGKRLDGPLATLITAAEAAAKKDANHPGLRN